MTDLRKIAIRRKLVYLFNWDEITKKDKGRLAEFLREETNLPLDISKIKKSSDGTSLNCELVFEDGQSAIYSVSIRIDNKGDTAKLVLTHSETEEKREVELVVLKRNDMTNIYRKIG